MTSFNGGQNERVRVRDWCMQTEVYSRAPRRPQYEGAVDTKVICVACQTIKEKVYKPKGEEKQKQAQGGKRKESEWWVTTMLVSLSLRFYFLFLFLFS